MRGQGDNEDQRNLFLWCGFPTLIGRHPKPPERTRWADGTAAVLCLSTSVCFWHTGVSALFSQEAAFPPFFFRGGSFGEVGTPTIVSQNKKEAGAGEGSTAHPLLIDAVAFLQVGFTLQGVNQRADA